MFFSILFPDKQRHDELRQSAMPEYFKDLNLDQVVNALLRGREEFKLEPFFYTPLRYPDTIGYRQQILRDLEQPQCYTQVRQFALDIHDISKRMLTVRESLQSTKIYHNNYLTKGRCLDLARKYRAAINNLLDAVSIETLQSPGLQSFYVYLQNYIASVSFQDFSRYIDAMTTSLATVEYCMLIKKNTIKVRKYEQQEDHGQQILAVFDKFKHDHPRDYRHTLSDEPHTQHVEAAVLNLVATLYKDIFDDLDRFCEQHSAFMDDTVSMFAREVQFYIAWLEYISPLRQSGLPFCSPAMSTSKSNLMSTDSFDLALAASLKDLRIPVVNSFYCEGPERVIVVTGPNQGGKTTFARTFGQLHHLGCIGCSIPGRQAVLFIFDSLFTIFEREEDIHSQSGKLQDDLLRLRQAFTSASDKSILIINEIFSSTTLQDAIRLGRRMMKSIIQLDAVAVCVTFLDELASYSPEVVSMMSMIQDDDPTQRTFKIIRHQADGLAYAIHIAKKHGLTYEDIQRRLQI